MQKHLIHSSVNMYGYKLLLIIVTVKIIRMYRIQHNMYLYFEYFCYS